MREQQTIRTNTMRYNLLMGVLSERHAPSQQLQGAETRLETSPPHDSRAE